MAKSTSIINLQGTVDEITFVKSRAYGNHIRAARGTHKKAEVNEAFKKESEKTAQPASEGNIRRETICTECKHILQ